MRIGEVRAVEEELSACPGKLPGQARIDEAIRKPGRRPANCRSRTGSVLLVHVVKAQDQLPGIAERSAYSVATDTELFGVLTNWLAVVTGAPPSTRGDRRRSAIPTPDSSVRPAWRSTADSTSSPPRTTARGMLPTKRERHRLAGAWARSTESPLS